jgi:hypothetical protein
MIHKLSGACFADRIVVHISNNNTLKSIYNPPLYSIIRCRIILRVTLPTVGKFSLKKENH